MVVPFLLLAVGSAHAAGSFGARTTLKDRNARWALHYLTSTDQTIVVAADNRYPNSPYQEGQTGKYAPIWGRDIMSAGVGEWAALLQDAQDLRFIPTLHWHWQFGGDSAWKQYRGDPDDCVFGDPGNPWDCCLGDGPPDTGCVEGTSNQVDVGAAATPGTSEHTTLLSELDTMAVRLQEMEDANVPVLWRPLHEIDGNWFWWSDTVTPANTAALFRVVYNYLKFDKGLSNLIWVYNASHNGAGGSRADFYPGASYVDIASVDVYGLDCDAGTPQAGYQTFWDDMAAVAPNKMLAIAETECMPDPDFMEAETTPRWLYIMPWYGTPEPSNPAIRPVAWARTNMNHDFIVSLDEMPAFGPAANIHPNVMITSPLDDGTGDIIGTDVTITVDAVDRDGSITSVAFYEGANLLGTETASPFTHVWENPSAGSYTLTAVATDNDSDAITSNKARVLVDLVDAALGQPVTVDGTTGAFAAANAVDGDYNTWWESSAGETGWIYVDLGSATSVNKVNVKWGWKIYAEDFTIDTCDDGDDPAVGGNWTTRATVSGQSEDNWATTNYLSFNAVSVRYVRMNATKRAQAWGGYRVTALEVPVAP
jgi:hypothetical protein